MSACYILSALGFDPVDPVSANYVFISLLLFDRATLDLANGKRLVVDTQGNGRDKVVHTIGDLERQGYTKSWFRHADIQQGGTIVFKMSDKPLNNLARILPIGRRVLSDLLSRLSKEGRASAPGGRARHPAPS